MRKAIDERVGQLPPTASPAWASLTMQPQKANLYACEFVADNVWRSLRDCRVTLDDIHRHTFIIIKPEGLARRITELVLDYIEDAGLSLLAATPLAIGRNAGHHVWRFQWNAATYDRIALTTFGNSLSPSLMLLLRDKRSCNVPAAVKMWASKGSAHADRRAPHHLRSRIRMHNRMLGFVHTPDEPADFVRELGILLDDSEQDLVVRMISGASKPNGARQHALQHESACFAHAVDPGEVINRVSWSRPDIRALWDKRSTTRHALATLEEAFGRRVSKKDDWDFLTIAAELIEHDRPGVGAILDAKAVGDVMSLWERER